MSTDRTDMPLESVDSSTEFQIIMTDDGSPSAVPVPAKEVLPHEAMPNEPMHSRQGALTESLYIYHEAMQFASSHHWPMHVLSVGLGLGYNELIFVGHLLAQDAFGQNTSNQNTSSQNAFIPERVRLISFESEPFLRKTFCRWLMGKAPNQDELKWFESYYTICDLIGQKFNVSSSDIKSSLYRLMNEKRWVLTDALTQETRLVGRYTCILYDAYSARTNPELWTEESLTVFLDSAAAPNCVFSTYAATGNLNRALREQGFLLETRKGFGGKRESTFAIRIQPKS